MFFICFNFGHVFVGFFGYFLLHVHVSSPSFAIYFFHLFSYTQLFDSSSLVCCNGSLFLFVLHFDSIYASFGTCYLFVELLQYKSLHFYFKCSFVFYLLACWPRTTKNPRTTTRKNASNRCPPTLTTGFFSYIILPYFFVIGLL